MKLIKFYSDTCGPCRVLDSNLKKAGVVYESVNVNENEELVDKYKIRSLPTLIMEDNGQEIERRVGVMTEEQIKHWCYKIN